MSPILIKIIGFTFILLKKKDNIFKKLKAIFEIKKVRKIRGKVIGQEMFNYGIALSAEKNLKIINKNT